MLSKFKTLLVAGAALPLATGFAFAQSAQPTTAPVADPPAVTATAPAAKKDIGALKATPAEKKASHEKTSAAAPATKTAALTTKHHAVRKHHAMSKTDTSVTGKAAPTVTAPKTGDAAPAKKL